MGWKPQQCSLCDQLSIPGLIKGAGKCPFHWAKGVWGIESAVKNHPAHPEAKKHLALQKEK